MLITAILQLFKIELFLAFGFWPSSFRLLEALGNSLLVTWIIDNRDITICAGLQNALFEHIHKDLLVFVLLLHCCLLISNDLVHVFNLAELLNNLTLLDFFLLLLKLDLQLGSTSFSSHLE